MILTSSRDEKLERAKELGADFTVNYRREPNWDERVFEYTEKRGVDVVVETAGPATFNQSVRCTRPGGTVALIGSVTGLEGTVNFPRIYMNRIRVAGIMVDSRAAFSDMVRFLEEHRIKPVIDTPFPFHQLGEAIRCMESGKHSGKIAVEL